jgi:hypothetical protein
MTLRQRWDGYKEHLRFKYGPKVVNWLLNAATYEARASLKRSGPLSILVDNTVLGHGVTHESGWVSTGVKKLIGEQEIEAGYLARIPVHHPDDDSEDYQSIKYLPGIAHLARLGCLALKTSAELQDETFRQPTGRFRGYGYSDYHVFEGIEIDSVDGWVFPHLGPSWMNLPSPAEQQRTRLERAADPIHQALVELLGQKNSQDAWHIQTAERFGLFCFLTMDWKLLRALRAVRLKSPVSTLRTRIMSPLELGQHLKIAQVPTNLLSYENASFPVRPDLFWTDGKRRPRSAYKKSR